MKRIQHKRSKGWRLPENAVSVARPSTYSNPFKLSEYSREESIRKYREVLDKKLEENPHFLKPLEGKDLACWCPLDKPCHADILIEYTKKEDS